MTWKSARGEPVATPPSAAPAANGAIQTSAIIRKALESARDLLDMDVAFLGQLTEDQEIFRVVVGDGPLVGVIEGGATARSDTYCDAMISGRIGRVVPDSTAEPELANLPITKSGQIGRYVGVPVHLPGGALYGVLCGIGRGADYSLGARDARFLEFLVAVVQAELGREQESSDRQRMLEERVRQLLQSDQMTMVFQPIVRLSDGVVLGFEALARIHAAPHRPPDAWFAEALEAGLGAELEMAAISAGLNALDRVPGSAYLSLNVSAATACAAQVPQALTAVDTSRVVLEITEHATVVNYEDLAANLAPLRKRGVRLAVDDAGSGVAGFDHILKLAPEIIKLDIGLTRSIDTSPTRRAMATALVSFGAATGAVIVAEGVETVAELDTLRRLGVGYGQGYLLGRPGPLPTGGVQISPGEPAPKKLSPSYSAADHRVATGPRI